MIPLSISLIQPILGITDIYTEVAGYIDLKHFFEAARIANSSFSGLATLLGYGVELFQVTIWDYRPVPHLDSGFSEEVVPSNIAGNIFDSFVQGASGFGAREHSNLPAGANFDALPDHDIGAQSGYGSE